MSAQEPSLLIYRHGGALTQEVVETLKKALDGATDGLNCRVIVAPDGAEIDFVPSGISDVITAIRDQTEANKHLANSIAMLASALAEQVDEEPVMDTYLDGSRAQ